MVGTNINNITRNKSYTKNAKNTNRANTQTQNEGIMIQECPKRPSRLAQYIVTFYKKENPTK